MKPSDDIARQRLLDTRHSCHAESPAGSGKTTILTRRFLALLGEVSHPREIIALTFTDKAAGEMRSRIVTALKPLFWETGDSRRNNDPLQSYVLRAAERHAHHRELLLSPDGLLIMTFHGFCNYLVRRGPFDAGVPPDYEILDEKEQPFVIAESIRSLTTRLLSLPRNDRLRRALTDRLLHHNGALPSLIDEITGIIQRRDRFLDFIGLMAAKAEGHSLHDAIAGQLRSFIVMKLERLRRRFASSPLGIRWSAFIAYLLSREAPAVRELPASIPGTSWEDLPAWRNIAEKLLTKAGSPRKRPGARDGFPSDMAASLWTSMISDMSPDLARLLVETVTFPESGDEMADPDQLLSFMTLASAAIEEYRSLCRRRRLLDFVEIEQAALALLGGEKPTDLMLFIDHRIRHILVDEFQDTNRTQWELLRRLTAGWEREDGRTLFIVGDPKQSIYAFRNAEVRLFEEAKRGIPLPGGGLLSLQNEVLETNFRSLPKLVSWTNEIFGETVMADPDGDADEVSFSPSIPSGMNSQGGAVTLSLFSGRNREIAAAREARWLAGSVSSLLEEGKENLSVGILLFTRNRLTTYLSALKEAAVPVQVQEGLALSDRPEVRYLLETARFLAAPQDDLAGASLFRSPWFWCDLPLFYEAASTEGAGWLEKIRAAASRNGRFEPLAAALENALLRLGRAPLGTVVERFWESLGGPRITAALYGPAGVENCRAFLCALKENDEGLASATINRVEQVLQKIYEPVDPRASESTIQLMTIHRAKGLEFDVVYIPFMDWRPLASGPRRSDPYLVERMPLPGGPHLVALAADRRQEKQNPLYSLLDNLAAKKKWGEAKRWFYVAATRAREALHLSGLVHPRGEELAAPAKSVLSWIFDHEGLAGIGAGERQRTLSWGPLLVDPEPKLAIQRNLPLLPLLPEALPFEAEGEPYRAVSPSAPAENWETCRHEGSKDVKEQGEIKDFDRVRGIVLHRLLHRLIQGGRAPSASAVTSSLVTEGTDPSQAALETSSLLEEVHAVLTDPFIVRLIASHPVMTEWALEAPGKGNAILSGTLDLAAFDGENWWIVDFKSGRPAEGENIDDFVDGERRRQRSQLSAYGEILAGARSLRAESVRLLIYFTALRLPVEL